MKNSCEIILSLNPHVGLGVSPEPELLCGLGQCGSSRLAGDSWEDPGLRLVGMQGWAGCLPEPQLTQ